MAAIDELAFEAEQRHGEFIDSGRVRQREGGVYAVHDGQGELVDIFNEAHEAFSFAAEVKEREDALAAEAEEQRQAQEEQVAQQEQSEQGEGAEQEVDAGEEPEASGPRAHPKFEEWVSDDGSQFVANQTEGSPLLLWDAFGKEKRAQFAEYAGVELSDAKWQELPIETRERLTEAFAELDGVREVWGAMDRQQRQALFPVMPKTDPVTRAVLRYLIATADISLQPAALLDIAAALMREREEAQAAQQAEQAAGEQGRPDAAQQQSESQQERAKLLALWEFLFGENRQSVATLEGTEFSGGDSGKLRFRIAEWYAKNGNAIVTVESVGPVKLDVPAVEHSLSHGRWRQKIAAFAAVPDVLRKGQLIHREPLRGARDGGEFLHFAAPIQIGAKEYIADVMVKTDSKGSRMYLHDVILTEKLRQPASQGGADAVGLSTEAVEVPTGEQSASTGARVAEQVLRRIYAVKSEALRTKSDLASTSKNEGKTEGSDADLGSPLHLRQPNAAATSLEGTPETRGKKPVSSTAVLNAFARVTEAVGRDKRSVNRVGRIKGRNALGTYNVGSEVTRIRTAGDTTTGAHELAHLIDDALWGRDFWKKKGLPVGHPIMLGEGHWKSNALNLSDGARGELRKLGNDLYREGEPHNGYTSEGFAEFVRLWLTDEAQARAKAPEFTKFWEGVLKERPKLAEAMKEASALAHQYLAQGSVARGLAGIVKQPTRTQALVEGTKKEVSEFRKKWLEAGAAIESFAEEAARLRGDEGGKLPVAQDPFQSFKAYRLGADAIVEDWAMHGMTDAGRNRTGVAPLNDAFNLVGTNEEQVDKFVVYLWAKRTVALYDDPKNGPRNSGLAIEDARHILETLGSPQFEKAAGIIYAWNDGVLDYVAAQSPALAQMVARIREVDPGFYIPLKREFAELERQYRASGGGSAARAQLTKRLKGSGRRIKHPVESMLAQAKDMVHKAHQRRVIDQVLHLARSVKGLVHYAVEVPVAQVPIAKRPMAELLQKVEQIMGSRGELAKLLEQTGQSDLFEEMVTFYGPAAEPKAGEWPVLPVWEEGKMKWFEMDPELYAALAHMDIETMSATTKWLGQKWARCLAGLWVRLQGWRRRFLARWSRSTGSMWRQQAGSITHGQRWGRIC